MSCKRVVDKRLPFRRYCTVQYHRCADILLPSHHVHNLPTSMHTSTPPSTKPDFSVDEYRPIKVVCIGAGFAGIVAGIRWVESRDPTCTIVVTMCNTPVVPQFYPEDSEPGSYNLREGGWHRWNLVCEQIPGKRALNLDPGRMPLILIIISSSSQGVACDIPAHSVRSQFALIFFVCEEKSRLISADSQYQYTFEDNVCLDFFFQSSHTKTTRVDLVMIDGMVQYIRKRA